MQFKFELEIQEHYAEAFEAAVEQQCTRLELYRTARTFSNPPVFRYVSESERPDDFVKIGMLISAAYAAEKAGLVVG